MHPLALGIVSDEISPDFSEALRYGDEWGITSYELRCLTSGRVPDVEKSEWDAVLRTIRERNLRITAVSPGIFKPPLAETATINHELTEVLPRALDFAAMVGAPLLIVFGFKRVAGESAGEYRKAVDILRRASEQAASRGMKIAIENEPGFWADSGSNTARLIRDVESSSIGANWDPCNSFGASEEVFPNGYHALRDHVLNVHVKDTIKGALVECVPIGDGQINWEGQLRALVNDGIVGHVTIETHCLPLVTQSRKNVETMKRLLDSIYRTSPTGLQR
jgi:sugar phosphate isomerase/epimerase